MGEYLIIIEDKRYTNKKTEKDAFDQAKDYAVKSKRKKFFLITSFGTSEESFKYFIYDSKFNKIEHTLSSLYVYLEEMTGTSIKNNKNDFFKSELTKFLRSQKREGKHASIKFESSKTFSGFFFERSLTVRNNLIFSIHENIEKGMYLLLNAIFWKNDIFNEFRNNLKFKYYQTDKLVNNKSNKDYLEIESKPISPENFLQNKNLSEFLLKYKDQTLFFDEISVPEKSNIFTIFDTSLNPNIHYLVDERKTFSVLFGPFNG
jgi:hypothetical protein